MGVGGEKGKYDGNNFKNIIIKYTQILPDSGGLRL